MMTVNITPSVSLTPFDHAYAAAIFCGWEEAGGFRCVRADALAWHASTARSNWLFSIASRGFSASPRPESRVTVYLHELGRACHDAADDARLRPLLFLWLIELAPKTIFELQQAERRETPPERMRVYSAARHSPVVAAARAA